LKKNSNMSYYRYITGVYKSYWPQLNRTLRSSSVPRRVPELDPSRYTRSCSVPPTAFFSNSFLTAATPFRDRAMSVPPAAEYTWRRSSSTYVPANSSYTSSYTAARTSAADTYTHYTDFDYKVIDYMGKLDREDTLRSYVKESRNARKSRVDYYRDGDYRNTSFRSKYNYYDAGKHGSDYLYPCTSEVMGTWKHYNLSAQTMNERNTRAKSPLVSRELDRYYETKKRVDYIGDVSSGGSKDFRFYNYRRVPYFGGSDGYQYMKQRPRRA